MSPIEAADSFLNNNASMEKYHQVITVLREIGFETVMRRLGEPAEFTLFDPMRGQAAAFEQAEKIGWYRCLDFLFNFDDAFTEKQTLANEPDFGANETLTGMGYKNAE